MALKMHKDCFIDKGWKVVRAIKDIANKHNMVLAGGTALALHLGHRISYDLDFFIDRDFKVEPLISDIRKTGLSFQVISEGEGTLTVAIEGVKVSFLRYEYEFLEPKVEYKGITFAGILDIATMKVIAINQRGTRRDFVDLYVILQTYPFYRVAEYLVRRYGKGRINPVHIGKSMFYFSDADSNPEPAYAKGKAVEWETVKKFFRAHARQFMLDLEVAVKESRNAL